MAPGVQYLNAFLPTSGTFYITSTTSWNITDNASWLSVSPVSGTNNGIVTVTATAENPGTNALEATVTITGVNATTKTVTVYQWGQGVGCLNETFTAMNGIVTDNSGTSYYGSGLSCEKLIQPSGATSITLTFTEFETESGMDLVRVYDGPTESSTLLGTFSGSSLPPVLTSSGGSMLIRFTTDIDNVVQGWSATYTAAGAGVLNVSPESIMLNSASGSSGTFNIISNVIWSITDNAGWLSVSPVSGSNNGVVTVTATSANTATTERSATVTVSGPLVANKTVTVTQAPSGTVTDYRWVDKELDGFWYGGRYDHAMAYLTGDKIVLHGGWYNDLYLEDTDVYDLSNNAWLQYYPTPKPSGRIRHAMAYIGNNKVLLFGGRGANDAIYGDTWIFDGSSNTWTQKTPASSPIARFDHRMVWMGGDKVMLFGGGNSYSDRRNDTWIFDLSDNSWTQMSPTTSPSGRRLHAMSRIGNGKAILFGGETGSLYCDPFTSLNNTNGETWIYDLGTNTWTQLNLASKPEARSGSAMAFLGGSKAMLYGGNSVNCSSWYVSLDDTWIFDLNSNTWSEYIGTPIPPASTRHNLAETSEEGGSIVLYGGSLIDPHWDDLSKATWVFESSTLTKDLNVSPTSISLGSALGSTGTFTVTSNTSWSITDNASWLSVAPISGTNNATVTVTATSANTGASPRSATVTIAGTGVASKTVTVTQLPSGTTLGNT
ncbi:MAG: kelch repeat-containing protein, partial [Bacteroidales bacterium]